VPVKSIDILNEAADEVGIDPSFRGIFQGDRFSRGTDFARHLEPAGTQINNSESEAVDEAVFLPSQTAGTD